MNYREAWKRIEPTCGEREAHAIVDYMAYALYGMSRTDLLTGGLEALSGEDETRLSAMLARVAAGEPVQYVIGRAEFCGMWLSVRPGVLIPRPETAELCRLITADRGSCGGLKVLDIGTGSGCIAIALKLAMPQSSVTAWDISPVAIATARANADANGAVITVERQDALRLETVGGQWDIIVSNPPYICDSERKDMSANVTDHEPHSALFVPDDDPLRFYRPIARYAARTLTSGGALYFELNPLYASLTTDMARQEGLTEVTVMNDMYGKRRMMRALKK